MTKRLPLLLLVLMLTGFAAGCGFKDIDKRFFVVSIGIDKPAANTSKHKYKVILKSAIPTAKDQPGQGQFQLVSQEADNIAEAIRLMQSMVDKEIDFGHAKLILFGESMIKSDIHETIDWFMRRQDIQKIAWVGIGVPSAETVLRVKPPSEKSASSSLFLTFGESGTESAYITSVYLFDFRRRLVERGLDPVLPIIKAQKETYEINQTALFDKKSLKLTLTPQETIGLNTLMFGTRNTSSKVPAGKKGAQEQSFIVIGWDQVHSTFTITSEKTIDVIITGNGEIEEAHTELSENELKKYERLAEELKRKEIEALLKKLQKAQLDPIGFGLRYRARRDGDWTEWQRNYANVTFNVNVDFNLASTGSIQ